MAVRALQMLTSSTTCWCIAVCAAGKSSSPEVLATGSTHGMFTNYVSNSNMFIEFVCLCSSLCLSFDHIGIEWSHEFVINSNVSRSKKNSN